MRYDIDAGDCNDIDSHYYYYHQWYYNYFYVYTTYSTTLSIYSLLE